MFTVWLFSPFFIFLFFSFSTYIYLIGNNFFPWKLNMKSPTSSLQPFAIEPGLRGIGSLSLLAFILVFFLSVLYCAVLLHHLSIISEKSFPFCMNIFKKLPLIRYDFLSKKFTKTATANGSLLHGASLYVHTAENIINFFFFFFHYFKNFIVFGGNDLNLCSLILYFPPYLMPSAYFNVEVLN